MTFSACRVLLHVGPAAAIMAVHLLHLPALPSSAASNLRFGRGDAQLAATTAMRAAAALLNTAVLFVKLKCMFSINLICLTTSLIFFWQIATRMEVSFKQTLFVCL